MTSRHTYRQGWPRALYARWASCPARVNELHETIFTIQRDVRIVALVLTNVADDCTKIGNSFSAHRGWQGKRWQTDTADGSGAPTTKIFRRCPLRRKT